MTINDNTTETYSPRGWTVSVIFFLAILLYCLSFWGRAAELLPAPLDRWSYLYHSLLKNWWFKHAFVSSSPQTQKVFLWFSANVALGLIVPSILLLLSRRKFTDIGIGLPNMLGRRMILVSIILSIPFGLWLMGTMPDIQNIKPVSPAFICGMLSIIPEHFLICGICVALMLPARKLPSPITIAPVEGNVVQQAFRWLGFAQPPTAPRHNRLLAWFGLTGPCLYAIIASGIIFGLTHIGKENPTEIILSFPGGVAVAYITLRSHSIWPAIFAHWAMNLIPLGIWMLLG